MVAVMIVRKTVGGGVEDEESGAERREEAVGGWRRLMIQLNRGSRR